MCGAAVMVLVYSRLTDPMQLLVAGAVMGFFVNGMRGGYGALISELFPTAARATALGRALEEPVIEPRSWPARRWTNLGLSGWPQWGQARASFLGIGPKAIRNVAYLQTF